MADPRGFLKVKRSKSSERAPLERIADYTEFVHEPSADELAAQASRCMDCGVPFCHQGCPLGNVIPEFNDLVWRGRMDEAVRAIHATNNFPEVTGRVCPALCEASCVLNINLAPVTIKDIERALANEAFAPGSAALAPRVASERTGKKVAVVGSGPAGLAAAQQLARAGHDVTLFERADRLGGLLRYGIPDFKLGKSILDLRCAQMQAEGVIFQTSTNVGAADLTQFDATVLALGARVARDLPVPGRDLGGVHFAMEFLEQQNRRVAGDTIDEAHAIVATDKHVVVVGGGDTGSDCVGTSNRQRAKSVVQLELLPKPPLLRMPDNPWPAWPLIFRTSSSHEEGCEREFAVMTKGFVADASGARVAKLAAARVELIGGKVCEIPTSSFEIPCDLALLAMGFTGPEKSGLIADLGLLLDARGNVVTDSQGATNIPGIFAAGDVSRGQSLVVWAIADGRRVASGVSAFLRASKAA
ncbi:MAG: glutamate synthase subunit beta [Polyangiaceae bacterium]|nr:glutamate synthase subunit beta [Polyangiaceae bacterium]